MIIRFLNLRSERYRPNWPFNGFNSIAEAREWGQIFVDWYNGKYKHSRIRFVTPSRRHQGLDKGILSKRKVVLEAAKAKKLLRWSREI